MNGNLYFDNVPEIGKLFMEHVLFSYENIPIIFVCVDRGNGRYLCICDDIIEAESWLIVKITNIKLLEILTNTSTVLSAFKGKKVVVADGDFKGCIHYRIAEYNSISKDELPICDQYLDMKDYLQGYIGRIKKEILSANSTLCFSANDILDDEVDITQFQPTQSEKIEIALPCSMSIDTVEHTAEVFPKQSISMSYSCLTIHEEKDESNNHSKGSIALAA